jgi:hypothetical protein
MASRPNPAQMAVYQAKLTDLVAARAVHQDLDNDHQVKNLNRQIQAQLKWIASAESASA